MTELNYSPIGITVDKSNATHQCDASLPAFPKNSLMGNRELLDIYSYGSIQDFGLSSPFLKNEVSSQKPCK